MLTAIWVFGVIASATVFVGSVALAAMMTVENVTDARIRWWVPTVCALPLVAHLCLLMYGGAQCGWG